MDAETVLRKGKPEVINAENALIIGEYESSFADYEGSFEGINIPSSATRSAGRVNCNLSAMAGFAAAH